MTTMGVATCWGSFALTWLAGAIYNAARGPAHRTRTLFGPASIIVAVIAWVIVMAAPHADWHALTVPAAWVRVLGLAILLGATAFTLWARLALGTMWSSVPAVKQEHELRTDGPYGITRHPIYAGILGMLLGTVLLAAVGRWAVIFPIALVVVEIRIHIEERLMMATFPNDYPPYRQRVPQLVPWPRHLLRRNQPRRA